MMGNHVATIDESRLHEWIDLVARKAGSACDARISGTINNLLKLLEDLQADKSLLTKVTAQQGELLRARQLDLAPMLHKLNTPHVSNDSGGTSTALWTVGTLAATLFLLLVIQTGFLIVQMIRHRKTPHMRPILKHMSCNDDSPTVRFELNKAKSASLKSILPV